MYKIIKRLFTKGIQQFLWYLIFIVQFTDPGVDFVEICGMGATGCAGGMRNPVCECDHANHYVAAGDQKSCVLGKFLDIKT